MVLYIDPGTGSMLFTLLVGVVGAAIYWLRMLILKLRFRLTGGKGKENEQSLPFVIFSDDKRYWPVFEPVCREMDRRGKQVVYMTASEDDPALENPYKHIRAEYIGKGNKAFARLNFLNATVVLSTTPGLEVYQWKRSGQVRYYVHLPHAASEVILYRMFGIDYYDAILLSGDYQRKDIRALEQLRQLPEKTLVPVGIPYMDAMARRYQEAGPAPEHPTTVLVAPSWGKSGLFSVYGGRIIEALLATGYHVIIRPHPQSFEYEGELMKQLMTRYPESEQLEWNRDTDNFEVLRRSDILISDFSGVIFDFCLVFDRPVIYTEPKLDLSQYDAWWLDTPLWTASALPRLGEVLTPEAMQDMQQLICRCLTDPRYAEGRRQVKQETWAHPGEGAKRTADFLVQKYKELSK